MRCFHDPRTARHDPRFRLTNGRVHRSAERAERAEILLGGLSELGLATETPPDVPMEAVTAVHSAAFVTFLRTAWSAWQALPEPGDEVVPNAFAQRDWARYPDSIVGRAGWHMGDTSAPLGEGSWEATLASAGCAVAAADAVAGGDRAAYALCRPPGHHTDRETAAGHCLLNVSAIAAERLRRVHDRVAILDIDVHHGNGTQRIFYERGDVLFVSVHADPADYYPFFLGYAEETGHGDGAGATLNLPLPRSTGDEGWVAAIEAGLERIAAFDPGALVLSLGLDAHENDPLKGMQVTFDGFRRAGRLIEAAGLPTAIVQEGGYLSPDLAVSLTSVLSGFGAGTAPRAT